MSAWRDRPVTPPSKAAWAFGVAWAIGIVVIALGAWSIEAWLTSGGP